MLVSVRAANDQLTLLQTLTVQEQLHRQTVNVFFKLLSDPSAVTDAQLERFTEQTLKVCLSGKLAAGLPVDYAKLREEMQFLVEAVLGKQFISRERHDADLKALLNRTRIFFWEAQAPSNGNMPKLQK